MELQFIIRHETATDYDRVEEVTREAFWNLYLPGCEEHYLVHAIRQHPDFIPELSFVIEKDGEVVGSIFYTRAKVVAEDGTEHEVVSFGPVSIHPSLHRKGLGRALITHSIAEAKKLGYRAIIIGGYPYHYQCYGFCGTKKYGISMPDGHFYKGIMALPLYDGALDHIRGSVHFATCMVTDLQAAEEYDKKFSCKEKAVTPSQAEFKRIVAELDLNE